MPEIIRLKKRAAELRRSFDLSFASPPSRTQPNVEDLLTVRVAGDGYAVRLRDIAGLVTEHRIVPIPASTPELLGLAGIHGDIVPVFGLSTLLGYAGDSGLPPWFVLCGPAEERLALGFSEFEGLVSVPKTSVRKNDDLRASRPHVSEIAMTQGGARPVIAVPLVVESLRNRSGRTKSVPQKER